MTQSRRRIAPMALALLSLSILLPSAQAEPAATQAAPKTGSFTIDGLPVDPRLFAQALKRSNAGSHFVADKIPNKGYDGNHPENFTDKSHFAAYIPEEYKPDGSWGLLVFMSPVDNTPVPANWQPFCRKRHLLLIVPQDVSNAHNHTWRVVMAVLASNEMTKAGYKLTPTRAYLVGSSGGGRAASETAVEFPDVFTGAICNCGVDFILINGSPKQNEDIFDCHPEFARAAATKNRFYLFTGSGDDNREETKAVYDWYKKNGFRNVTYFEQEGAGHAQMSDENFDKGLAALDAPLEADVTAKVQQAEALIKQNLPGNAILLLHQAAATAPGSAFCDKPRQRADELIATYQTDLAEARSAIESGDKPKGTAALASLAKKYATFAAEDIATLRKSATQPKSQ